MFSVARLFWDGCLSQGPAELEAYTVATHSTQVMSLRFYGSGGGQEGRSVYHK